MGHNGGVVESKGLSLIPMGGVPYLQPLAGHEPQYVPTCVLSVRPSSHPISPVPLWAASLPSQA